MTESEIEIPSEVEVQLRKYEKANAMHIKYQQSLIVQNEQFKEKIRVLESEFKISVENNQKMQTVIQKLKDEN